MSKTVPEEMRQLRRSAKNPKIPLSQIRIPNKKVFFKFPVTPDPNVVRQFEKRKVKLIDRQTFKSQKPQEPLTKGTLNL